MDYFIYSAMKEIGALAAVLGGLDGIVFTAGIDENPDEFAGASAKPPAGSGSNWILK